MAKIKKIVRIINKGDHAKVYVQLEDGDEEYVIYIGGNVEVFLKGQELRAFVKKGIA